MVHELAHCLQMNHSGAFWKVRNQFAGELRQLWERNYSGDGLWGKGQTLLSGEYDTGRNWENEVLPTNLCGGTFRSSRGRKRKKAGEGKRDTYAERQQRRMAKRFGTNGVTLGADEVSRVKSEIGKKPKGKPRVAGSMRGRELRATAALARFEQKKEAKVVTEEELFQESDSETESDSGDLTAQNEAVDLDGSRMRDGKGRGMIKVCEGEDPDDIHVKREIGELRGMDEYGSNTPRNDSTRRRHQALKEQMSTGPIQPARPDSIRSSKNYPPDRLRMEDIPLHVEPKPTANENLKPVTAKLRSGSQVATDVVQHQASKNPGLPTESSQHFEMICPICSMTNALSSLLCLACSHVLDTTRITKIWRCQSEACQGSQYINAADCGLCGVCGSRKGDIET